MWLIFFFLLELRQRLVREQADVFHRHVLGHAAEVEGAGNRRQPDFLAPFANAIGNALGIPGKNKSLLQLRLGVAVQQQSLLLAVRIGVPV